MRVWGGVGEQPLDLRSVQSPPRHCCGERGRRVVDAVREQRHVPDARAVLARAALAVGFVCSESDTWLDSHTITTAGRINPFILKLSNIPMERCESQLSNGRTFPTVSCLSCGSTVHRTYGM